MLSSVAFGIANAINNIGMAIYPILFGWINTPASESSYVTSTLFLIAQAAAGAVCMGVLWWLDMKGLKILNRREKKAGVDGELAEDFYTGKE